MSETPDETLRDAGLSDQPQGVTNQRIAIDVAVCVGSGNEVVLALIWARVFQSHSVGAPYALCHAFWSFNRFVARPKDLDL